MHSLCKYNPNGEGLISDKKEFQVGKKITKYMWIKKMQVKQTNKQILLSAVSPNKADTSDKSYSSWQFNCLIICINSLWQLGILHILIQFCPSPGTCLTILAWQCAVCFKLIIKWQFHSNKGVFQLVRGKSIYYYLCIRNRLCDWRKLLHLANEMEKIHKHLLETSEGWNLPEEVFFYLAI